MSSCAGVSVRLSVAGANPSAVTTTVYVPGVGSPRSVNEPTGSSVSVTVSTTTCPALATTVAPPTGPAAPLTEPAMDPSPVSSDSWIPLRSSPAATSTRCTALANPALETTRSYTAGDGRSATSNVPSAPIGTVRTTAPVLPVAVASPASGSTTPASGGTSSGSSTVSWAPPTSAPVTVPVSVAGTPPTTTVSPPTVCPVVSSTGCASGCAAADGYQTGANPAPVTWIVYSPAGRSDIANVPSVPVACVFTGCDGSSAPNSSTVTSCAGAPVLSWITVPSTVDVPVCAAACRACATWMARSRSAADRPTTELSAIVMMRANVEMASRSPSSPSMPRDSSGFCTKTPDAAGGASVGGADGPSSRSSNGRSSGSPTNGRFALAASATDVLWPGARLNPSGSNVYVVAASGSRATSRACWTVLPSLRTTAANAATLPAVTVAGSRLTVVRGSAGTSIVTSSIAMAAWSVTSRTWTDTRRSPAGIPSGSVRTMPTDTDSPGNSRGDGSSISTHDGSAPSTRSTYPEMTSEPLVTTTPSVVGVPGGGDGAPRLDRQAHVRDSPRSGGPATWRTRAGR